MTSKVGEVLIFHLARHSFRPERRSCEHGCSAMMFERNIQCSGKCEKLSTEKKLYQRRGVDRGIGQTGLGVEGRQEQIAKLVRAGKENGFTRKGVGGQKTTEITNDGLKKRSVGMLKECPRRRGIR